MPLSRYLYLLFKNYNTNGYVAFHAVIKNNVHSKSYAICSFKIIRTLRLPLQFIWNHYSSFQPFLMHFNLIKKFILGSKMQTFMSPFFYLLPCFCKNKNYSFWCQSQHNILSHISFPSDFLFLIGIVFGVLSKLSLPTT